MKKKKKKKKKKYMKNMLKMKSMEKFPKYKNDVISRQNCYFIKIIINRDLMLKGMWRFSNVVQPF